MLCVLERNRLEEQRIKLDRLHALQIMRMLTVREEFPKTVIALFLEVREEVS